MYSKPGDKLNRLVIIIICTILAANVPGAKATNIADLRSKSIDAYRAIEKAESAGGNVTKLSTMLDKAVKLVESGGDANLTEASTILDSVIQGSQVAQIEGSTRITNRYIYTAITVVTLGIVAVLVWVYGSKIFWGAWLRSKGEWRVEKP